MTELLRHLQAVHPIRALLNLRQLAGHPTVNVLYGRDALQDRENDLQVLKVFKDEEE